MMQVADRVPQFGYNLMQHIQKLGKNFEEIKIEHIYCEVNHSADVLAKQGCNGSNKIYDSCPMWILPLLKEDLFVSFVRHSG